MVAKVAELADALDLGSSPVRGGGSTPPFRTTNTPHRQQPAGCELEVLGVWTKIDCTNSRGKRLQKESCGRGTC